MSNNHPPSQRRIVAQLSIAAGNFMQLAGMALAVLLLASVPTWSRKSLAFTAMVGSWILLYFFCHAITHWAIGRMLGIRFVGYTVGGTGNPEGYPPGLRWVFVHLPFFGVRTSKASMQSARPLAKAIMWSAGVTSSAIVPTLAVFWSRSAGIPGSKVFLLFAVAWALGTLASNWTSRTGDYAKARRALSDL